MKDLTIGYQLSGYKGGIKSIHINLSLSLAGCAASHFLPGYIEGGRGGLPLRLALRSAPEGHVEPCEY